MRLGIMAVFLVACSDPADFAPAKGARDYKQIEERAASVTEGDVETCTLLGSIKADGPSWRSDISITTARHGGTHYVLRDHEDTYAGTQTTVTRLPFGAGLQASTTELRDQHAWAKAYRCGGP